MSSPMDQGSAPLVAAPVRSPTTSTIENDERALRTSESGARLPAPLQGPVATAHTRLCSFVEHQAGAVRDWKTDTVTSKLPGRVFYLVSKQKPMVAVCPDMAVDVTSQVRMEGRAGSAALLQEPLKAGSMVQLPGGILTKVLGFLFDLQKTELSLKIVLGWPTKQALSEDEFQAHGGVHVSYGTQSVLPLDNGHIGLLIAVSEHPISKTQHSS